MDFAQWYLLFYTALGFLNLGLIWVGQLVVYPLFDVRADAYSDYHVSHGSRIPLPVIVPGFALMLSTLALPFFRPDTVPLPLVIALVACALVAMYVTFAMEIPRHKRLEKGESEEVIRELIRYNWPRRLSQACAALLALWMLAAAFAPA